jgi:hypothetical protein
LERRIWKVDELALGYVVTLGLRHHLRNFRHGVIPESTIKIGAAARALPQRVEPCSVAQPSAFCRGKPRTLLTPSFQEVLRCPCLPPSKWPPVIRSWA